MKKGIYTLLLLILNLSLASAQELNMRITVNSDKISGTDKGIFSSLQDQLNQFVNGRKWTDTKFAKNERIECSMLITINSIPQENSYKAEIQVTSSRPVYNSSYTTTLFNFKDDYFDFDYIQGQNIEFAENNITDNLSATVAFYAYVILGLDFDSFSQNEGKIYFEKALNIATSSQSFGGKGWATFGSDRNRYALAISLTDGTSVEFVSFWYAYHRKGLDEMAANPTRGRTEIIKALPALDRIYQSSPSSPILYFFADAKLSELVGIYSKATADEKKDAVKLLEKIYPAKKQLIDNIEKKSSL